MELKGLLQKALAMGGSDMFVIPGSRAMVKVQGHLAPVCDERLAPEITEELIRQSYELAGGRDFGLLLDQGDDDFSFGIKNVCRFRCNAFRQRGSLAATYRVVAFGLPDEHALHIPEKVMELVDSRSGLVLVTGPAGSGKSTTLACMVNRINNSRQGHIITIEDPIEYLHPHRQCLVTQREVPNDAPTFARALRAALRQAPDVIMLGEMRDYETMQTALTAAETGHLVLSSLHTAGAAKTIDRIIDAFPADQQQQVRVQLSMTLNAVASQRLVPAKDGSLKPVFELMTVNPAVRNMIRDGRTYQIDNVIYSGCTDRTMISMDNELAQMCRYGELDRQTALMYAMNPETLGKRI